MLPREKVCLGKFHRMKERKHVECMKSHGSFRFCEVCLTVGYSFRNGMSPREYRSYEAAPKRRWKRANSRDTSLSDLKPFSRSFRPNSESCFCWDAWATNWTVFRCDTGEIKTIETGAKGKKNPRQERVCLLRTGNGHIYVSRCDFNISFTFRMPLELVYKCFSCHSNE